MTHILSHLVGPICHFIIHLCTYCSYTFSHHFSPDQQWEQLSIYHTHTTLVQDYQVMHNMPPFTPVSFSKLPLPWDFLAFSFSPRSFSRRFPHSCGFLSDMSSYLSRVEWHAHSVLMSSTSYVQTALACNHFRTCCPYSRANIFF